MFGKLTTGKKLLLGLGTLTSFGAGFVAITAFSASNSPKVDQTTMLFII